MVMLLFKTNHLFPNILKAGEYIHHIAEIMAALRVQQPAELGGQAVSEVKDYQQGLGGLQYTRRRIIRQHGDFLFSVTQLYATHRRLISRQQPAELGGQAVSEVKDYQQGLDGLPKANVLKYVFAVRHTP